VDGVKSASKAFYTALAALDGGAVMEKVWAHTPYVTYVGPCSKTIIVGCTDKIDFIVIRHDSLRAASPISMSSTPMTIDGYCAGQSGFFGKEPPLMAPAGAPGFTSEPW
jgi:hypothetical protein